MKFGRFEIDSTVIISVLITIFLSVIVISTNNLDIEKEKTKQIMYEKSLVVIPEENTK